MTTDFNRNMMLLPYITFLFLMLTTSISLDIIDVHLGITDGETIVSGNDIFELGFFSPGSSKNRYLGIWFKNTSPQTVAWVANRESPLIDTSGRVKLDRQGILSLVNGVDTLIWSSNSSVPSKNVSPIAQLLDSGNLVIKHDDSVIWQSFDYPGDTYLSGMKLGKNLVTGREMYLIPWKSADDPSPGEYTIGYRMVKGKYPQDYIKKGPVIQARIGPYNGIQFAGLPNFKPDSYYAYKFYMVVNQKEMYFMISFNSTTYFLRSIATPGGKLEIWHMNTQSKKLTQAISLPMDNCDIYGICGPYGSCSTDNFPNCGCLKGFERINTTQLNPDNWTSGCQRQKSLDCGPGEGFLRSSSLKLPDTQNAVFNGSMNFQECEVACKSNCSCTAYANPNMTAGGIGCLLWFGDLIDIRVYPVNGQDLYVRLAASELLGLQTNFHSKNNKVIRVTLSIISAGLVVLGLILTFYAWSKRKKRSDAETQGTPVTIEDHQNTKRSIDVPLFSLSDVSRATNDFSLNNKLGEGGFGQVYKVNYMSRCLITLNLLVVSELRNYWVKAMKTKYDGILQGVLEKGQEIAIKRLSKSSMQGHDEFENEVICIAKLQHRNLVKLLGYCIQDDETMLIYEYMANKSLDLFIFDDSRKSLLGWKERFHIINGIARGLLYLHQDSRLRVVHRDLKAGNILLDQDMNPKISDFGLARMFKGHESEANTKRVVGTLGYISPEYATNGLFSIKSDIFSFGVLVLEIVSGKKNRSFAHEDHHDSLLGHAWRLYKEGKSLDLIDASLGKSWSVSEVMRSIHVGLLCVQQRAEDRPATPFVVSMLGGESSLPSPKQPGFFIPLTENDSTSTLPLPSSLNEVTLSQVEGR